MVRFFIATAPLSGANFYVGHSSVAVKNMAKGNLWKKRVSLQLHRDRRSYNSKRQVLLQEPESSHLPPRTKQRREGRVKLQSLPLWCTSCSKAILPKPSKLCDQLGIMFKCLNLWGTFLIQITTVGEKETGWCVHHRFDTDRPLAMLTNNHIFPPSLGVLERVTISEKS